MTLRARCKVERFLVVTLSATQRSGHAGDERSNDQRQRSEQREGSAGLSRDIRCLLRFDLSGLHLRQHCVHTGCGVRLRQSRARRDELAQIGLVIGRDLTGRGAYQDASRLCGRSGVTLSARR